MIARLLAACDLLLQEAQRARKWDELAPLEAELRAALGAAWDLQGRRLIAALRARWPELSRGELAPAQWADIWRAVDVEARPRVMAALAATLPEAVTRGARAVAADLGPELLGRYGVTIDPTNPRAIAYLRARLDAVPADLQATTAAQVDRIILEAAEQGLSWDATARRISARFSAYSRPVPNFNLRTRAELVATTELGNAFEHGNQLVARQLSDAGLAMEKAWLTAEDSHVDDECAGNEAAGWIPLDAPFPDGSDRPLAHAGCRCSALYRVRPAEEA